MNKRKTLPNIHSELLRIEKYLISNHPAAFSLRIDVYLICLTFLNGIAAVLIFKNYFDAYPLLALLSFAMSLYWLNASFGSFSYYDIETLLPAFALLLIIIVEPVFAVAAASESLSVISVLRILVPIGCIWAYYFLILVHWGVRDKYEKLSELRDRNVVVIVSATIALVIISGLIYNDDNPFQDIALERNGSANNTFVLEGSLGSIDEASNDSPTNSALNSVNRDGSADENDTSPLANAISSIRQGEWNNITFGGVVLLLLALVAVFACFCFALYLALGFLLLMFIGIEFYSINRLLSGSLLPDYLSTKSRVLWCSFLPISISFWICLATNFLHLIWTGFNLSNYGFIFPETLLSIFWCIYTFLVIRNSSYILRNLRAQIELRN